MAGQMQDKTGGYCPKCNTVWASPGVCKCKIEESVLYKEIWNTAIEEAAKLFPYGEWEEIDNAIKIRKLKK